MPLFKKKSTISYTLIIDIRSSSVGAAIFKQTDDAYSIVYTHRVYQFFKSLQDVENFLAHLQQVARQCLLILRIV